MFSFQTPLFLAVEKRMEEVVSYLLECGANANFQTRKSESDAPLHHAAARGMAEIVQALCATPSTDKNLRNGLGRLDKWRVFVAAKCAALIGLQD